MKVTNLDTDKQDLFAYLFLLDSAGIIPIAQAN